MYNVSQAKSWKCKDCRLNRHTCFHCNGPKKENDPEVVKCDVKKCGRFYHKECITKIKEENKDCYKRDTVKWRCPLHFCKECQQIGQRYTYASMSIAFLYVFL